MIDRIDLDAVAAKLDVDAVVARADLDAVIDRIDIVGIIEEVLDVIDLPAIIRDSTGSMASETVRGARMTSINADDALSRVVDRALFRRRHARTRPVHPAVTGPEISPVPREARPYQGAPGRHRHPRRREHDRRRSSSG